MRTFLKVLAVIMIVVTVAAMGLAGYAWVNRFPVAEQGTVRIISAEEQPALLENWQDLAQRGVFPGTILPEEGAETLRFVQYTVRLKNKGVFPAEWLTLETEVCEGDRMIYDAGSANVLEAGAEGDLILTLLRIDEDERMDRELTLSGYVLGVKFTQKMTARADTIRVKGENAK